MATNWRDLLACENNVPALVEALETLIRAYEEQSTDQASLYGEVLVQAGVYRMAHWATAKRFVPSINQYLDHFGNTRSECKKAFKYQYEANGNLSVADQSQLLKAQYGLISNRHDPYRFAEMKRRGLVTEDGIMPLGLKASLAILEQDEPPKPKLAQQNKPVKRNKPANRKAPASSKFSLISWLKNRFRKRRND